MTREYDGRQLARAIRDLRSLGYEYRTCDACGGVPESPDEPGVICSWCAGEGTRLLHVRFVEQRRTWEERAAR